MPAVMKRSSATSMFQSFRGADSTRSTGAQAQDKDRRAIVGLEGLHHAVALIGWGATVQEEHIDAQCFAQMALQQRAHLDKLGKDQCMITYR